MTEAKKYLWFIILLHAVFFALSLTVGNINLPDSGDYIWQAKNFASSGSFYANNPAEPIKIDYYSKRPPLYGLLIWALWGITGTLYSVIFLQNILSILTAWLIYKILKEEFKIQKAAIWSAALWLVFPNQLLYANMIMSETLLQFSLITAYYFFIKFYNTQQIKWVWLNNILLAVALLTKPVMVYFWILNAAILLLFALKTRRYLLPLPVLILPLVVLMWSEANYRTTGYRHYSSITHVNLKDYNTKYFLFAKYGSEYGDSVIAVIDSKAATMQDYAVQSRFIKDTCTRVILSDVPAYGKFHARGMVNFMVDPGRYDYVSFFSIPQTDGLGLLHYISKGNMQELKAFLKTQPLWLIAVLLLEMLANGFVLVLCVFSLFNKGARLWPKIYIALIAGYVWFLTGPIGSARFKVPIYPFIIIAAAIGLQWAAERGKKDNYKQPID